MNPLLKLSLYTLGFCALFAGLAYRAVRKGEFMLPFAGKIHYVRRAEMPLGFWFCFGLHCFFAVMAVFVGVFAVVFSKPSS